VAALPPVPWREAVEAATSGSNPVLAEYLRRAIEPVAGADARLATLHAVLRRGEAAYTLITAYHKRSPSGSPARIIYRYTIDTWDMGLWRPVCRKSVVVLFVLLGASGELTLHDAVLGVPSCFKKFGFYGVPARSCPPTLADLVRAEGSG
jgi:hypothetical protein